MFHASEVELEVGFAAAQSRLISLAHTGGIARASHAAREQVLAGQASTGEDGRVRPVPALTRVCHLSPVCRAEVLTVPVRWEAAGAGGPPEAVLDANLTLVAVSARLTRLGLVGAYRLPPGTEAERLAAALGGALLASVARALTGPGR